MEELKPMLPIGKNLTDMTKIFLDWETVLASPKIDGVHVLTYNNRIVTRNGFEITNRFPSLISWLSKQQLNLILDCELVAVHNNRILPRREIHRKILSDETKGLGRACLMIFDALKIGDDITSLPFNERYSLIKNCLHFSEILQLIPQRIVKNEEELQKIYKKSQTCFEGLMLRDAYAGYEVGKRSFGLRKLKPIDLMDLKVVGKEFVNGLKIYSLVDQKGSITRVKDSREFKTGEFVEIGYERKYASGKLKFPTIIRRRLDKCFD